MVLITSITLTVLNLIAGSFLAWRQHAYWRSDLLDRLPTFIPYLVRRRASFSGEKLDLRITGNFVDSLGPEATIEFLVYIAKRYFVKRIFIYFESSRVNELVLLGSLDDWRNHLNVVKSEHRDAKFLRKIRGVCFGHGIGARCYD